MCLFLKNLVELNLFAQVDLTSKNISYIVQFLKHLKKLDISHTKSNLQVFEELGKHCQKLEKIYADNCACVHDACLDVICNKLSSTITEISLGNVCQIGKQATLRTLRTCPRLRYFYVNQLLIYLNDMMSEEEENFPDEINQYEFVLNAFLPLQLENFNNLILDLS